ncbi:MAG: lipid II flippase MurJ [Candidatus Omnitrophota bacterium]
MKVVFTGGGTGGHVYPNIAIYEAIKEKYPGSTFLYVGAKKGAESRIVKNLSNPIEFIDVPTKGLPRNLKSFHSLIALLHILLGTIKSYFILKRFKPDIVIGSGGYASAPILFAAHFLKIKSFIHEQNAVPGRLNQFIARFAARIGVSFSATANFFPEDKVVVTGYPLRKAIRFNKSENVKEKYKIPERNKVIFIFGGSLGSRTINNAVAEIIPTLMVMPDLTVIWSTGRGYSQEYKAFDDTIKIFEHTGIHPDVEGRLIIREYFDNIDEIYSITDLIISRAGAGTIKEITTLGIPCILVPKIDLPGDHQILNAREVEKIGGAKIVYETITIKNNKQSIYVPEVALLKSIKETLLDGETLFNMRKNLRKIEKQNSTEAILNEIELLVEEDVKTDETQVKVYYLQPRDSEKNIELIFDSTTIGTSSLCDAFLEKPNENILVELRILKSRVNGKREEKLVARRIKGTLRVDGDPVEKWAPVKDGSILEFGSNRQTFVLRRYFEKVRKVHVEKGTFSMRNVLSPGMLVSRIGGFFREIFIAGTFGAGKAVDMFAAALSLVYFFRRMLAEHALGEGFLPIFLQAFRRNPRKKTWEAASSVINFSLLVALVCTAGLFLFAPFIVAHVFPGFAERGHLADAIRLTRLVLPYLVLVTASAVMVTYLKAFGRLDTAEVSSVLFSVGTVLGILVFYATSQLYSMAYGVLLGGGLQLLFLLSMMWKTFKIKSLQFTYRPTLNFRNPFSKKYYSRLLPVAGDVFLGRTADLVGKLLASRIGEGVIAFLHFSLTVFLLPFTIISHIITGKILKDFNGQTALFEKKRSKQIILDGIKINFFLLIPVSILLIFLARPLVSILFERGRFTTPATIGTAAVLQLYAIGLIGWGLHALTARIFATRMEIRLSLLLNVGLAATNIVLSIILIHTRLSFKGLPLATSISYLLFSAIRIVVLKKKMEREGVVIKYGEFLSSFAKTSLAAALMVTVLIHAGYLLGSMKFTSMAVRNLALLFSLTFISIAVYFLTSLMLKNTGLLILKKKAKKTLEMPISMLSPFKFLEKVATDVDAYREDYFYKINIYLSSHRWEIKNIGIKLVGLFKDSSKVEYVMDILKMKKANGFMRRNAVQSLRTFGLWNPSIKVLMLKLLDDPYYEVRSATIDYLTRCCAPIDYKDFKPVIHSRLRSRQTTLEEKLACLKLIAKIGEKEELTILEPFLFHSNALVREELMETLYQFYRRKVVSVEELKDVTGRILITSNNLNPEFKLKSIIKRIYKEIE